MLCPDVIEHFFSDFDNHAGFNRNENTRQQKKRAQVTYIYQAFLNIQKLHSLEGHGHAVQYFRNVAPKKQVWRAVSSNLHPIDPVGCNYLSLPLVPAYGTTLLIKSLHDDVIKWQHFPRYWPFVWGIHRSSVNSPYKGQWHRASMFSLICAWINGRVNNRHYVVTVMSPDRPRNAAVELFDITPADA